MAAETIIETEALTKVYGDQKAVDQLTLSVQEGEIFGFLGPNGAGKTTTILMLLGLTMPTSGKASVYGFNPIRESIKVKKLVGYLPEHLGFYEDMRAADNLKYVARLNRLSEADAEREINQALEVVGLSNDLDKRVGAFSRGMRQRLGIAETLIKGSKLIILDEPTLGLDPDASNRIVDLIRRLAREKGMSIVLSSHDLRQVQKICDRIGIMIKGRLVALGPIEQLAEEKLGVDQKEYTLESLYMKYFQEG